MWRISAVFIRCYGMHCKKKENILTIKVKDYSDTYYYSRGKQKLENGGMFYTAQSGIWQTVWMEKVPEYHIKDLKITPLYDQLPL